MAENRPELRKRKRAKTNIGILLDAELWKRFRVHCLQTDQSPGELVGKLINDHLTKVEKKKSKEKT